MLLVLAVLVPAVCLLWFMRAAMRNERLAARQTLAEVYRGQLASSQAQLDGYWQTTASKLEERARKGSAATAFAECVQFGAVDSVIVFDEKGNVAYPNVPTKVDSQTSQFEAKWAEASQLEFARKDYLPAAAVYHAIAIGATNVNLAARALQAEARCLVQADRKDAAIRLVTDELARERYDQATDPQGRLIAANAELMVLELLSDQASPAFQASARKLHQRLADYANPVLASPQRCFLMKELQSLWPEVEFPTLAAEELAVKLPDSLPVDTAFHRTSRPEVWQFATADRRVLAFVRSDKILASVRAASTSADAHLSLIAPGGDPDAAFVSVPAGPRFPGWRLALSLQGNQLFDAAADHRKTFYLWTALFVLAAMGVLTLLTVRVLRRHATLARLKNDLAATVSHELKTPLSSTRVLVDTLLDTKSLDERKTREYLRLIAQENERLSRVVQNFLSFSRMEQRKYAFRFSPLSARQTAEAAIAVMRERLEAPGCRFELHIDDALPGILADGSSEEPAPWARGNGRSPVSARNSVAPSPKMSTAGPISPRERSHCSGAM